MAELYVYDMAGTTTPMSYFTDTVPEYIRKNPDVIMEVRARTGIENVLETMESGIAAGIKGDKDNPDFKAYVIISDTASDIAYEKGELPMPLEEGVKEAFEKINGAGRRIEIYSSGDPKSAENGLKTTSLHEHINKYHSPASLGVKANSKNVPDGWVAIANEANANLKDTVAVTDSPKEAVAAIKAGYGKVYLYKKGAQEEEHTDGYTIIGHHKAVPEETLEESELEKAVEGQSEQAEAAV